ncbi:hypothetical protein [Clostridium estertheticum]|uniref:hypothetical protein n=1 Tax=Clostridium estertheticum TaxID=238834 RepID=UPI001CF29CDC|nr:hypothetical protein [Clostridium estertheticum]MCB2340229.1 hypothetical protein [Clostridium estertheticum]
MTMLAVYVLIISVPIIIIISAVCGISITEYEMKPNKLTRLFYCDDEIFIKYWKKRKEKGILMNNLKTIIIFTAWYGIMVLFFFLKDNNSIMYRREHILLLVTTTIIFALISSLISWGQEHHRYIKLKEKVKNENIKNLKE